MDAQRSASVTKVSASAPILLRRMQKRHTEPMNDGMNMTVVTTQGAYPEKHDQKNDKTAPRRDW